jgi:hypothetical protein
MGVCSKISTNKNFVCHRQVLSHINHEKSDKIRAKWGPKVQNLNFDDYFAFEVL